MISKLSKNYPKSNNINQDSIIINLYGIRAKMKLISKIKIQK